MKGVYIQEDEVVQSTTKHLFSPTTGQRYPVVTTEIDYQKKLLPESQVQFSHRNQQANTIKYGGVGQWPLAVQSKQSVAHQSHYSNYNRDQKNSAGNSSPQILGVGQINSAIGYSSYSPDAQGQHGYSGG